MTEEIPEAEGPRGAPPCLPCSFTSPRNGATVGAKDGGCGCGWFSGLAAGPSLCESPHPHPHKGHVQEYWHPHSPVRKRVQLPPSACLGEDFHVCSPANCFCLPTLLMMCLDACWVNPWDEPPQRWPGGVEGQKLFQLTLQNFSRCLREVSCFACQPPLQHRAWAPGSSCFPG